MIKLVSCAYHANIGDSRGSTILGSFIEAFTGIETELCGYEVPMSLEFIKKLNDNADAIVIGNGGTLMPIHKQYSLFTPIDELLRHKISAPVIIWSSGFNYSRRTELVSEWIDNITWLLSKAKLVGLRTEADIKRAKRLVNRKYYLCPDPLMFVGKLDTSVISGKVGLCLHKHHTKDWGYDQDTLISMVKRYTDNIIILDHETMQEQLSLLDYVDLDFVVTDRFHGCVLAAAFGKPFYAVDWNIKIKGMADLFSIPYMASMQNPEENFRRFVSDKGLIRKRIKEALPIYRSAYVNFAIAATKVIKNGNQEIII